MQTRGQVQSVSGAPALVRGLHHPLSVSGLLAWSFHICEMWVFPGGLAPVPSATGFPYLCNNLNDFSILSVVLNRRGKYCI